VVADGADDGMTGNMQVYMSAAVVNVMCNVHMTTAKDSQGTRPAQAHMKGQE
jgi:hypothetical protein